MDVIIFCCYEFVNSGNNLQANNKFANPFANKKLTTISNFNHLINNQCARQYHYRH